MSLNKDAAAALDQLADEQGRLTPETVVRAAEAQRHPLHDYFEWDDSIAGHQHRLNQARTLIRSVQVHIKTEKREISVSAFIRDPERDQKDAGYRRVEALMKEPQLAHEAVAAEMARAGSYLRRARDLAEALGYQADIVEVEERVQSLRTRILEAEPAHGSA